MPHQLSYRTGVKGGTYNHCNCASGQYSSMTTWRDQEVFQLVDFWSDDVIQCHLEECKRNKDVYEKISKLMQEKRYTKTAVQCREKIKKIKGEYRKIKDQHKTGTGRKKWRFYDALDSVLGNGHNAS